MPGTDHRGMSMLGPGTLASKHRGMMGTEERRCPAHDEDHVRHRRRGWRRHAFLEEVMAFISESSTQSTPTRLAK
jgi:hypothetical protein